MSTTIDQDRHERVLALLVKAGVDSLDQLPDVDRSAIGLSNSTGVAPADPTSADAAVVAATANRVTRRRPPLSRSMPGATPSGRATGSPSTDAARDTARAIGTAIVHAPHPSPLDQPAGLSASPKLHAPAGLLSLPWLTGYMELRGLAQSLADAQIMRISAGHRLRQGLATEAFYDLSGQLEHEARLTLRRAYRRVVAPEIRAWQESTLGLGIDLMARLLGNLGHPRIAVPMAWLDEAPEGHICGERCGKRHLVQGQPYERTVSQLWAYCGLGDPAIKRRVGMSQEDALRLGSWRRKTAVWLNAGAAVKAGVRKDEGAPEKFDPATRTAISPLGQVYLDARRTYAERDWSDGHQQAAAIRKVGKEILRDLWIAAGPIKDGAA